MKDGSGGFEPEQSMVKKVENNDFEAILAAAKQKRAEALAKKRLELEHVKKANPDKEPFDIQKFAVLYDLTNDDGKLNLSPERIEKLEMEYYLDNSEMQTLAEFAERREWLDGHNAG